MLLCAKSSQGFFQIQFRQQLLATLTVTIMTFSHGVGLGWFAPMVTKLQSDTETPLEFTTTTEQISWVGALICIGGCVGNIIFGQMLDTFGRKFCIYCLAVPHMCFWILVFAAKSVNYLYVARFCAGVTGGGTYVVIPIFIGEIADPSIRGRLTSCFQLTYNCGMLFGFILSSHVHYHIIPCAVIGFPVLFIILETFFPETPPYLLRCGKDHLAQKSLQFYLNTKMDTKQNIEEFNKKFTALRNAVLQQKAQTDKATWRDFFTKNSLRALGTCLILMLINAYTGTFALLNYTSSIFMEVKAELHPDTNTIIIGIVQIIGTYTAIIVVDRFGRRILLITSTASVGLGLAAFGMYAFFAEETSVDLTPYRSWVPLVLIAFIILTANMGVIPLPFVLLVEILPPKIRSVGASVLLATLSVLVFSILKVFPPFMESFGLSAAVWFCSAVAALGLFYITLFVEETKGKSVNESESYK